MAWCILRLYATQEHPSNNLVILAKFLTYLYFPSWFQIKEHHFITDRAKYCFDILVKVKTFSDDQERKLSFKVLQGNVFFANDENVFFAVLADDNEEICNKAVLQALAIRETKSKNICGESEESPTTTSNGFIRRFLTLSLNFEATCYYGMINKLSASVEEPSLTQNLLDNNIAKTQHSTPICLQPCHNQAMKCHMKVITEALVAVFCHFLKSFICHIYPPFTRNRIVSLCFGH